MRNNTEVWETKNKEIAYLCKKVLNMTYDDYHYVFLFANCDEAVKKHGKIEALDIVINALKESETPAEALENVFKSIGIVDLNSRPDIVIDTN